LIRYSIFHTVDSDMSIATIRRGGAHGTRINHQNKIINENWMYTVSANADGRMSCPFQTQVRWQREFGNFLAVPTHIESVHNGHCGSALSNTIKSNWNSRLTASANRTGPTVLSFCPSKIHGLTSDACMRSPSMTFGFRPVRWEYSYRDRRTPHSPSPFVIRENNFVPIF
jgi:hypothetical protein